jgi:hypothetical protein
MSKRLLMAIFAAALVIDHYWTLPRALAFRSAAAK